MIINRTWLPADSKGMRVVQHSATYKNNNNDNDTENKHNETCVV